MVLPAKFVFSICVAMFWLSVSRVQLAVLLCHQIPPTGNSTGIKHFFFFFLSLAYCNLFKCSVNYYSVYILCTGAT